MLLVTHYQRLLDDVVPDFVDGLAATSRAIRRH